MGQHEAVGVDNPLAARGDLALLSSTVIPAVLSISACVPLEHDFCARTDREVNRFMIHAAGSPSRSMSPP
jgi:hypothetical protein